MSHLGVVVMSYGTPSAIEEIEPYYTHIRRGRPPSRQQLDELVARYEAIGGLSPLGVNTAAQRDAIERAVASRWQGEVTVCTGNKHVAPFIEDAVAGLDDCDIVVGVVLAPHFSAFSVGEYHSRARARCSRNYRAVDHWFHLDPYVEFYADQVSSQLAPGNAEHARQWVIFTAHSLPERVLVGDPYIDQLTQAAQLIRDVATEPFEVLLGWQSAGRTPEPWIGPDILDLIDQAANESVQRVIVVPHGFTSDHLEVLYDLDIEAATRAAQAGVEFMRTQVVGNTPTVMDALGRHIVDLAEAS